MDYLTSKYVTQGTIDSLDVRFGVAQGAESEAKEHDKQ